MSKITHKSSLTDINAEIRRLARLINDRVYRTEYAPDPTGLYAQSIAKVAAYAEKTNPRYRANAPRLSTARAKTKDEALKKLTGYQRIQKQTENLTRKGQSKWYESRVREVNERTGLSFDRKTYEMLIRLQHSMGDSMWASSQLLEFFGTLAVTPKQIKTELPFNIASYDDIVDYLMTTSFPADELKNYIKGV